ADTLVVVGGWDESGPRVEGDPVRGEISVRSGHAVARDRAEDDPLVHAPKLFVPEAPSLECAGTHRLDDGVSAANQVEVDLDRFAVAQIERDTALAPVYVEVQQGLAFDDRPRHPA